MIKSNINFNSKLLRTVGLGAVGSLIVLGFIITNPQWMINESSSALSCGIEECKEGYTSTYANVELGAAVASVVSIGLDSKVEMEITPKSGGVFTAAQATLTVSTNNETGFAVYMTSSDDGLLTTATNGGGSRDDGSGGSTTEATTTIKPMIGTSFDDRANTNAWGYSIDGTNYQAVPTTTASPIIKETNVNIASGNKYNLTFGVNVDTTLPAGYYSGSVTVSAVANPITISSLSQLVYMQDMTSDICNNTADYIDLNHYVTKQLIDTRDGNKYWVAKLADGNCWMTQNLALDITEAMASATGNNGLLNSTTTDIGYNANGELIDGIKYWNADSEYPPEVTNSIIFGGLEDANINPSWSFGDIVLGIAQEAKACTIGVTASNSPVSAYDIDNLAENCQGVGFVDVSGSGWRSIFSAQQGTLRFSNDNSYTGIIAVNQLERTYDAHYLLGNFYSWNAAMARAGQRTAVGSEAQDSICPSGWKMPSLPGDSTNGYMTNGSWKNLLRTYNMAVENSTTGSISTQGYKIDAAPLYLIRSGLLYSTTKPGYLLSAGGHMWMWSSTKRTATSARYVEYGGTVAYGFGNEVLNATPIRCLAR